jgi:hypothetical protein
MPTPRFTTEVLAAAIEGYQQQKTRIDAQIAELRAILPGGSTEQAGTSETLKGKRRKMSAAGRARMAEAQRKRWAESKGHSASPSEKGTPKPKRKMSAAGKAAIVAATKKRWKAFHAAKNAGTSTVPKKRAAKKTAAKKA